MKTKLIIILIIGIVLESCVSNTNQQIEQSELIDTVYRDSIVFVEPEEIFVVNFEDSINYTDSNGLKQGQWIKKWKNKIVNISFYTNDTLNGLYRGFNSKNFCSYKVMYVNGEKEGYSFYYYPYDTTEIGLLAYYNNGEKLWIGFPLAGQDCLIPIKDFKVYQDSTKVKAVYKNGKLWYEGNFNLRSDDLNFGRLMPYRYGIHKVYHKNGQIKGIIDYTKKTIKELDSLGNLMYSADFEDWNIHQQPTLGRY